MTSDIAIRIEGVGKRYEIGELVTVRDLPRLVRHAVTAPCRRLLGKPRRSAGLRREQIWAIEDISFEVRRGEVVGIIGRNGAGKSTLLKVLSRITGPTTGRIELFGRVGALLEVGTGFHPELTGRENIYLSGAILGMRHAEIKARFDEIVDFAGVERFMDTPVKRYSSGMRVRLGFAVAAHLSPEILIIDEVLAVGDVEFQQKCLGKMGSVAHSGRTVLFVSHNMGSIQSLCTRGILLHQGRVALDGSVSEAVDEYVGYLHQASGITPDNPERSGTGQLRLTAGRFLDHQGRPTASLVAGRPATIELEYTCNEAARELHVGMTVVNAKGVAVTHVNTKLGAPGKWTAPAGTGVVTCRFPSIPFLPGTYRVAVAVSNERETMDLIPNAVIFTVDGSLFFPGGRTPDARYCACMVDHAWGHRAIQPQHKPTGA